jgi:hypothetical protein
MALSSGSKHPSELGRERGGLLVARDHRTRLVAGAPAHPALGGGSPARARVMKVVRMS